MNADAPPLPVARRNRRSWRKNCAFTSSSLGEKHRRHDRGRGRRRRDRIRGVERAAQRPTSSAGWWLGTVTDVRYALRGFRRNAVFTVTVIATLAVASRYHGGVSVVDRFSSEPLPMCMATGWSRVGWCIPGEAGIHDGGFFFEWPTIRSHFEGAWPTSEHGTACLRLWSRTILRNSIASTSTPVLPMLEILAVLGRNFLPEEVLLQRTALVIVSYGCGRPLQPHPGI